MRGSDEKQQSLFSYKSMEQRVPEDHPIRWLRTSVDDILAELSPDFDRIYASQGRPSIPPEHLLKALLIQVLFTVRSERQLMEQLDYNLLYRWFVGLGMDDPVWDPTTFTKNRDRLLEADVANKFFEQVLSLARQHNLMSNEHFTVDGTIIEAWASHKSFRPKNEPKDKGGKGGTGGRNADVNFKGQKRLNDTHESTTDPDARLFRKSRPSGAQLCYLGHVLMENRNGLVVSTRVTEADGFAEREAAKSMLRKRSSKRRITLGADKGYDSDDFVQDLRELNVTPHIAQNINSRRGSQIGKEVTRHPGYAVSQVKRKLVEQCFGWGKTIGGIRKTRFKGLAKVNWMMTFAMAAYNLIRVKNLVLAT